MSQETPNAYALLPHGQMPPGNMAAGGSPQYQHAGYASPPQSVWVHPGQPGMMFGEPSDENSPGYIPHVLQPERRVVSQDSPIMQQPGRPVMMQQGQAAFFMPQQGMPVMQQGMPYIQQPGIPFPQQQEIVGMQQLPAFATQQQETQPPGEDKEQEDAAQAKHIFRETVGRLATSMGHSYAGDMVAMCSKEYKESEENYLRGCKWSPDGKKLVTNSNDNCLRIFDIPDTIINNQWDVNKELQSRVLIKEPDLIYDFCWYSAMTSDRPETCLVATTTRDTPIHLHSAITGEIVHSYRPYNNVDEIEPAHSIGFTSDGKYLVSGFNRKLRTFDVGVPGRDCTEISTVVKEKDGRGVTTTGQRGILSCFAAHPTSTTMVAAGAFNGDVGIYDVRCRSMSVVFVGQKGGITHLTFTSDGNYLYAGGRKDPEINCFDMRNPEKVLYVLFRYVATNQRMYFDLDKTNQYLLSGNHNGKVTMWDLRGQTHECKYSFVQELDPIFNFQAHQDTVNGCSINPHHPVLATCSGQRHFHTQFSDDDDDEDDDEGVEENTLKLWNLKLPTRS